MKQMRIECEYNKKGIVRKCLTFPVPDEMAPHMKELMQQFLSSVKDGTYDADPTKTIAVDGSRNMMIYVSVMDAHGEY